MQDDPYSPVFRRFSRIRKRQSRAVVLAPVVLPPPINGMTVATREFLKVIGKQTRVEIVDIGNRKGLGKIAWSVARFLSIFRACISVIYRNDLDGSSAYIYQACNSGPGLIYNLLPAILARMNDWSYVLHHHVYRYIDKRNPIIALIDRIMGSQGIHIALSEGMRSDFADIYNPRARVVVIGNSYAVSEGPSLQAFPTRSGKFQLGHISKLSYEKGLDLVLEAYAQAASLTQIELLLAGPIRDENSRRLIETYSSRYSGISYLGPLYGNEKSSFYQSIDLFLFPTRYRNEAQPLVLLEALAHGVPVISLDRGCIKEILGDAGFIIPGEDKWINQSQRLIMRLARHPEELARLKGCSLSQFRLLRRWSEDQIMQFLSNL